MSPVWILEYPFYPTGKATVSDRLDSLEESRSELSAAVKALAVSQQEHTRILSQYVDILNRLVATQTHQVVLLTQIVAARPRLPPPKPSRPKSSPP